MEDTTAIANVVDQLYVLETEKLARKTNDNMRASLDDVDREVFLHMFRDRLADSGDIVGAERLRRAKAPMTEEETAAILGIAREWNAGHPYTIALAELPRSRCAIASTPTWACFIHTIFPRRALCTLSQSCVCSRENQGCHQIQIRDIDGVATEFRGIYVAFETQSLYGGDVWHV
jgi:hypothetical protein